MADIFLWNKEHLHSVKASKIREFGIYDAKYEFLTQKLTDGSFKQVWKVLGWYNANEHFEFGYFDAEAEAQEFVEALHSQILANK